MSVRHYCQPSVCTIGPEETVRAAAQQMEKEGVGCLVVAESGRPVGMLTDRDIVLETLCRKLDAGAVRVSEIAKHPVLTIAQDAPLVEAARLIRQYAVRRLPVVDEKGELAGLLAVDDLMLLAVGELAGLATVVRRQAPGPSKE
jgi:CBS domain-containing protein